MTGALLTVAAEGLAGLAVATFSSLLLSAKLPDVGCSAAPGKLKSPVVLIKKK
jgi:hypothetical protein